MSHGRVSLVVLGCAKNQVEAESMSSRLSRMGWDLTSDISSANVTVIHTCGFLEAARQEALDTVAEVRKASPRTFLVMTGCFSQFVGNKKPKNVDALLGTGEFYRLPEILNKKSPKTSSVHAPAGYHDAALPRPLRPGQLSAYLRISEGCNHRCTFCIIPQLRGNLKSRLPEEIHQEARHLISRGIKELCLISQDTTDYGGDLKPKTHLTNLLKEFLQWPDLNWIRLMYSYPSEVNTELIEMLKSEKKLCGYLDMPLQHIADRMLKSMGRKWGKKETMNLLHKMKKKIPHLSLRTTFIVGFPGETEKDFKEILDLIKEDCFEHVGVFPYSLEKRSPSYQYQGQVDPKLIEERWQRLTDTYTDVMNKRNQKRIGKEISILLETDPHGEKIARGRHQAPEVDGTVQLAEYPDKPGFYRVKIESFKGIHLQARLLRPTLKKTLIN